MEFWQCGEEIYNQRLKIEQLQVKLIQSQNVIYRSKKSDKETGDSSMTPFDIEIFNLQNKQLRQRIKEEWRMLEALISSRIVRLCELHNEVAVSNVQDFWSLAALVEETGETCTFKAIERLKKLRQITLYHFKFDSPQLRDAVNDVIELPPPA